MKHCNFMRLKNYGLMILMLMLTFRTEAQNLEVDNDTLNKKRLNTIIYTGVGLYSAALVTLYFAWYKDSDLTSFHFFNDNANYLQLDKLGHSTTAYTLSYYSFESLKWAGVNNNKSAIYGGLMGFGAMTVIEILDGFSATYGSSWGDLIANGTGTGIFMVQQLTWKEQRFRIKYSYHPTQFADYNPNILGNNALQRTIKDYNGITYWLSGNIASFLPKESHFPKWINVAVGYGGTGIIGATDNPEEIAGKPIPHFDRTRQYYLSLDIDWTRINTHSKFLQFTFKLFSFIKLPFPTLEYNNKNNLVFHWIYF